jgi:hypothetical protein
MNLPRAYRAVCRCRYRASVRMTYREREQIRLAFLGFRVERFLSDRLARIRCGSRCAESLPSFRASLSARRCEELTQTTPGEFGDQKHVERL